MGFVPCCLTPWVCFETVVFAEFVRPKQRFFDRCLECTAALLVQQARPVRRDAFEHQSRPLLVITRIGPLLGPSDSICLTTSHLNSGMIILKF